MMIFIIRFLQGATLVFIIYSLICLARSTKKNSIPGWRALVLGFTLVLFGTLLDITGSLPALEHSILINDSPIQPYLKNVVGYLFGFIFIAIGIRQWLPQKFASSPKTSEIHNRTEEEELHGLLSICASCKKIREENGYWTQLEAYITQHSAATFSHCICPDCVQNIYPEDYEQIMSKSSQTHAQATSVQQIGEKPADPG